LTALASVEVWTTMTPFPGQELLGNLALERNVE
jgi:hypothetical protein